MACRVVSSTLRESHPIRHDRDSERRCRPVLPSSTCWSACSTPDIASCGWTPTSTPTAIHSTNGGSIMLPLLVTYDVVGSDATSENYAHLIKAIKGYDDWCREQHS